jgi:hypothetical protein
MNCSTGFTGRIRSGGKTGRDNSEKLPVSSEFFAGAGFASTGGDAQDEILIPIPHQYDDFLLVIA